ncbi:DUF1894 domain-containing protein [Methanosarcina mazei]|uniref:DUF1894 domain-containing protein n=4 Tax=Methanosarcina mazei TaxID=2209 RepID=A0A0F8SLR3_METMZ|nr:DUF1894 domain-containing protein [Methanosarcina mazei]AGF96843.1 hypothetical protein MmTuc01_1474 [Methanosarcina mazei Tuc01]AKB42160.1 hypothetical protein MSMAW_3169 [Methanosarcina mazei WWM610]AKB73159.1 hypothetical protein MSMAC_3269 [Methanosarcina mazei C16]KKG03451.1 hypothetical protein DU40_10525 [Methanosarcina mazei]KKG06739.1 hypothetical protein DU47_09895 [Methanosarcina mazei]
MSCIEQMKYTILLDRISFKEAREYIEKNSDEVYYVSPGYKIFKDYYIIGVPPIAMGAKGNALIFPYTKPCHGSFVLNIENDDSIKEINRLRDAEKGKGTGPIKKAKTSESSGASSASYLNMWKK